MYYLSLSLDGRFLAVIHARIQRSTGSMSGSRGGIGVRTPPSKMTSYMGFYRNKHLDPVGPPPPPLPGKCWTPSEILEKYSLLWNNHSTPSKTVKNQSWGLKKKKRKLQSCFLTVGPGKNSGIRAWAVGPPSLEKSQKYRVLCNTGLDPPEKSQSYTQPAFNVGPSSTRQGNAITMAFRWLADDGPLLVVFGFSLPSATKKICQSLDPSDKTVWLCPRHVTSVLWRTKESTIAEELDSDETGTCN